MPKDLVQNDSYVSRELYFIHSWAYICYFIKLFKTDILTNKLSTYGQTFIHQKIIIIHEI